jgi:membrane-bound lytic murein transglycosylase D
LRKLAANPHPRKPSNEETRILKLMSSTHSKASFLSLARNVRSQTGQRDNVIRGLMASEPYLSKMEIVFREMSIPLELTRLPLVESSFNINATSRVGAAGVWQFMPKSAREYLTVDSSVDERLSPLKATVAAGRLLKRNYSFLGDWPLAVISFNHGIRGLPRFGKRKHSFSDIAHLFTSGHRQRGRLGWASKNYYAEFLAMLHAEAYRETFYGELPKPAPYNLVFDRTRQPVSAVALASTRGVQLRNFAPFNPDIRDFHASLPEGFWYAYPAQEDDISLLTAKTRRSSGVRKVSVSRKRAKTRKTKRVI